MPLAYGLTESVDLHHPAIPTRFSCDQAIQSAVSGGGGLRVAHLTDLHIVKPTQRLSRLIYQLGKVRLDLGLLTGDFMIRHRPCEPALSYLRELTESVHPIHGWVGVFGNHDTAEFVRSALELPVHWLADQAASIQGLPVDVVGLGQAGRRGRPDGVAAARAVAGLPDTPGRLRLALTHRPDDLPLCADLGADLAFAGHTHGGQVRIPLINRAIYNSSDLPIPLSAGMLRHQDTVMLVPRGLGSTDFLQLPIYPRLCCPPHAPIYTLRHGTMPGEHTDQIQSVWAW